MKNFILIINFPPKGKISDLSFQTQMSQLCSFASKKKRKEKKRKEKKRKEKENNFGKLLDGPFWKSGPRSIPPVGGERGMCPTSELC